MREFRGALEAHWNGNLPALYAYLGRLAPFDGLRRARQRDRGHGEEARALAPAGGEPALPAGRPVAARRDGLRARAGTPLPRLPARRPPPPASTATSCDPASSPLATPATGLSRSSRSCTTTAPPLSPSTMLLGSVSVLDVVLGCSDDAATYIVRVRINHERNVDSRIWYHELTVIIGRFFSIEGNATEWSFRLTIPDAQRRSLCRRRLEVRPAG